MKLKVLVSNSASELPAKILDLSNKHVLEASCKDLGIDDNGLGYFGCGVWEVPQLTVEVLEAMSPDMSLISTLNDDQVFLEDAYSWLDKHEDDDMLGDSFGEMHDYL